MSDKKDSKQQAAVLPNGTSRHRRNSDSRSSADDSSPTQSEGAAAAQGGAPDPSRRRSVQSLTSVAQVLRAEILQGLSTEFDKLRESLEMAIRMETKAACSEVATMYAHGGARPASVSGLSRQTTPSQIDDGRRRVLIKKSAAKGTASAGTESSTVRELRRAEAGKGDGPGLNAEDLKRLNRRQHTLKQTLTENVFGRLAPVLQHISAVPEEEDMCEGSEPADASEDNELRSLLLVGSLPQESENLAVVANEEVEEVWQNFFVGAQVIEDAEASRPRWVKIIESVHFDYTVGAIILLNCIWTGIETEYIATRFPQTPPVAFVGINFAFSFWFALEFILRTMAYGWGIIRYVNNNIVDTTVIFFMVMDQGTGLVHRFRGEPYSASLSIYTIGIFRLLRVFRLIRILSTAQILERLGELRMMIVSVVDCFKSLIWAAVFILTVTFMFGVFLTSWVVEMKKEALETGRDVSDLDDLDVYFSSLCTAILFLLEGIFCGVSWGMILDPMMHHRASLAAGLFLLYVGICMLGLLNMVTGVFMAAVMKRVHSDQKIVLQQRMETFFVEADDDGSGTISYDEFVHHLEDESFLKYLDEIDLTVENARELFCLLDTEEAGEIAIADVVSGCLRLHGPASALDLSSFIRSYEKDMDQVTAKMDKIFQEVRRSARGRRDHDDDPSDGADSHIPRDARAEAML
eukprot:TRINITY_DN20857_c2_g1_i1.p1 TRINITY_DN20857_c2_g1~~TRINITY_DN20857_c2_g1_i1.p1  ORF type:complete len:691 (+),score=113.74 TRINITY_DN20857_c2_g1_i1:76-2148(+)